MNNNEYSIGHEAANGSQGNDATKQWEEVARNFSDLPEGQDVHAARGNSELGENLEVEALSRSGIGRILLLLQKKLDVIREENKDAENLEKYRDKILELEDEMFDVVYSDEPKCASRFMAETIGVLGGIKPAMCWGLSPLAPEQRNLNTACAIQEDCGLSVVSRYREGDAGAIIYAASKSRETAERALDLVIQLWHENNKGPLRDAAKCRRIDWELGKKFGYPDTAIEAYLRGENAGTASKRNSKGRYIANSAKHEKKELKQYDRRINQLIMKYSPRAAEVYSKDGKPWP